MKIYFNYCHYYHYNFILMILNYYFKSSNAGLNFFSKTNLASNAIIIVTFLKYCIIVNYLNFLIFNQLLEKMFNNSF